VLTAFEFALELARPVNQHPAQAKACRAALAKAHLDQAALANEGLVGEFPADPAGYPSGQPILTTGAAIKC
jgi:hypothetical protein